MSTTVRTSASPWAAHMIEILAQSPAMAFLTGLGAARADLSRCALRSVEGGLEDVADVLAGR